MVRKKTVKPSINQKVESTNSTSTHLPPNYKPGIKRPYFSTNPTTKDIKDAQLCKQDYLLSLGLFLIALYIRLKGIQFPKAIIFDEVHIIRHINDYINGTFFLDITPPFGKLVYSFVARLLGYKGDAVDLVTPGQPFQGTGFPFIGLRVFSAMVGSGVAPLAFFTLRSTGVRISVSAFGALLVALENSFIISSRLMMSDSISLFLLALGVYGFKKFQIMIPFTKDWARYLVLTGIALGLGVSTKWIGGATIVWVGLLSLQQLWYLFGDIEVSNAKLTRHVLSRISFLLMSPIVIYLGAFAIHILLLNQTTEASSLLSTHFQRTMSGNRVYDLPRYVTGGSTVTIRHADSMGGFLHSHPYPYKSGSGNQQVTVFDYDDYNNEWIIEPLMDIRGKDRRLKGETLIRLRHKNTGALLRVDDFKAPISEQDYEHEVSCFGNHTYPGNDTDAFLMKVEGEGDFSLGPVKAIDTKFRLWNKKKRCTVISHDIKLPNWGFGQQEVICIESPTVSRAIFFIETVKYPDDVNFENNPELFERVPNIKPSFLSKFYELNTKMLRMFKSIKPKATSTIDEPTSWPMLPKGIKYFTGSKTALYFIGNPIVWWLSMMLIPSFIFVKFVDLFRPDYNENSIRYKTHTLSFLTGWIIHFIPYIFQDGEFFISYYTLSLYFGILIIGITFEYIYCKKPKAGQLLSIFTLGFAYYFYVSLSPITYASEWDVSSCQQSKLLDTWDYDCGLYRK